MKNPLKYDVWYIVFKQGLYYYLFSIASSFNPFSCNFLFVFSVTIAYIIERIGSPITIPIIPNKLPPIVIATNTQILGSPIFLPTTCGYIKFPSICCNTMINIININALIGSIATISTAPTKPPIKAPTIGIKAVNAVKAPTVPCIWNS